MGGRDDGGGASRGGGGGGIGGGGVADAHGVVGGKGWDDSSASDDLVVWRGLVLAAETTSVSMMTSAQPMTSEASKAKPEFHGHGCLVHACMHRSCRRKTAQGALPSVFCGSPSFSSIRRTDSPSWRIFHGVVCIEE
eukprot:6187992-Pleurochrysis_carterae.AAC.2